MPRSRRGKRVTRAATLAGIAAAFAVHGTVLGAVDVLDLRLCASPGGPAVPDEPDLADLLPSCVGDAVLTASARETMCAAPWRDDLEDCTYDTKIAFIMQMSGCYDRGKGEPPTAVSVVAPNAGEKFKPIDPEPLIAEMLEQEKKPIPPPPVPPLTPAQPQPQPPAPPAPPKKMQVVETVKPQNEKAPDHARLLSEYDITVEKQKVNRGARNEPMVAKAKPEELT